jgi:hypothetical protein
MKIYYWISEGKCFFNWDRIIHDLLKPGVGMTPQYSEGKQESDKKDTLVASNLLMLNRLSREVRAPNKGYQRATHDAFIKELNGLLCQAPPPQRVFMPELPVLNEEELMEDLGVFNEGGPGGTGVDLSTVLDSVLGTTFDESCAPVSSRKRQKRKANDDDDYFLLVDESQNQATVKKSSRKSKKEPFLTDEQLTDLLTTLSQAKDLTSRQKTILSSTCLKDYDMVKDTANMTLERYSEILALRRKAKNLCSAKNTRKKSAEEKASLMKGLEDAREENIKLKEDNIKLKEEVKTLQQLIAERDGLTQTLSAQPVRLLSGQGSDSSFFSESKRARVVTSPIQKVIERGGDTLWGDHGI